MDRHDALEMDALLRVVLDDFELRMRDDDIRAGELRPPVDDERVPLRDHFLHPRRIEPPAHEPPAERTRVFLLQQDVEHPLPAADPPQRRLFHNAAHAHRAVAGLGGETVELRAILVAPWKVHEQRAHRRQAETLELARTVRRHHFKFGQWGLQLHARTVAVRIWGREQFSARPIKCFDDLNQNASLRPRNCPFDAFIPPYQTLRCRSRSRTGPSGCSGGSSHRAKQEQEELHLELVEENAPTTKDGEHPHRIENVLREDSAEEDRHRKASAGRIPLQEERSGRAAIAQPLLLRFARIHSQLRQPHAPRCGNRLGARLCPLPRHLLALREERIARRRCRGLPAQDRLRQGSRGRT